MKKQSQGLGQVKVKWYKGIIYFCLHEKKNNWRNIKFSTDAMILLPTDAIKPLIVCLKNFCYLHRFEKPIMRINKIFWKILNCTFKGREQNGQFNLFHFSKILS